MIEVDRNSIPEKWQWFYEARFGVFLHWGVYSVYGLGEQVLFREHLDHDEYAATARAWNPKHFNASEWAEIIKSGGAKYAVLTTRHHDGFCLWDSKETDYTSVRQSAGRDFVAEYVDACRKVGLRVGLYYSLGDWRMPAFWEGPENDPDGWNSFREKVHAQVRELLTNYGKIDVFWFDGDWPRSAMEWKSVELIEMMRKLQPDILINNRAGKIPGKDGAPPKELGDFGTPEQHIARDPVRLWESCQVSTWRMWGYATGDHWKPANRLLDALTEAASKGGNLLLNVGPDAEGKIPNQFVERIKKIGEWLKVHGEAVYNNDGGEVCEMITRGYQTFKGNNLYLIIRFWNGKSEFRLAGLATKVLKATLLTTAEKLEFEQKDDALTIQGLPEKPPTELFPVIKLECLEKPRPVPWAADFIWHGNPRRMTSWAKKRKNIKF